MPVSPEDHAHVKQLDKHRQNWHLLETQAAEYSPATSPLHMLKIIASEEATIDRYEAELADGSQSNWPGGA